ncbi:MAG: carbon-phosphorus lyase complex subunit PhnI [Acidimicrobiia bacterium]|nr:carbon-phosphorus lyase complex subunit PhnI [Acidimicrobiia bacterium]
MTGPAPWLEIEQIISRLRYAVDQVMSKAGPYDERTAARAFRRAEGDPEAAANLVQALRAALPRFGAARPVERRWNRVPGDRGEQRGGPMQGVRRGELPVIVTHPVTGEAVTIGHVRVIEAEIPAERVDRSGQPAALAGYGVSLGHNDRQAVALARLDVTARNGAGHNLQGEPAPDPAGPVSAEALLE